MTLGILGNRTEHPQLKRKIYVERYFLLIFYEHTEFQTKRIIGEPHRFA